MYWEFQPVWCIVGLIAMVVGVLVVRFHKQICDNLAGGVANYEKMKLAGLIISAIGFIFMTCLHTTILRFALHIIAPGRF